jgi:hypothetical protein
MAILKKNVSSIKLDYFEFINGITTNYVEVFNPFIIYKFSSLHPTQLVPIYEE